jgi:hypothetical protein
LALSLCLPLPTSLPVSCGAAIITIAALCVRPGFALAIRIGDPLWFFAKLLKSQICPPAHGFVLAAVLLIGGIDHRLGIIPSPMGWTLTIAGAYELPDASLTYDRTAGIVDAIAAQDR